MLKMKSDSLESVVIFVLKEILILTKENRELREEVKALKETQPLRVGREVHLEWNFLLA